MPKSHLVIPSHPLLTSHPVVVLKYSSHQIGSLAWMVPSGHLLAVVVKAAVVLAVFVVGDAVVGRQ